MGGWLRGEEGVLVDESRGGRAAEEEGKGARSLFVGDVVANLEEVGGWVGGLFGLVSGLFGEEGG